MIAEWCYLHLIHGYAVFAEKITLTVHTYNNKAERHFSHITAKRFLRKNDVQSVADGCLSAWLYIGLIFMNPVVKLNEICHWDLFLPQKLPPAVYRFSGEFIFRQDTRVPSVPQPRTKHEVDRNRMTSCWVYGHNSATRHPIVAGVALTTCHAGTLEAEYMWH